MTLTPEQQLAMLLSGKGQTSTSGMARNGGHGFGDSPLTARDDKYQGAGMDWDPQQYRTQPQLLAKLSPDMATKLEGVNARAKSMSVDPSMNADLRRAFGEQAALLSGGTNLGEYEAMRASPSQASNSSMGGGWSSNNSANAGLAQGLMRDQQAAAEAHKKQEMAANPNKEGLVNSFAGVKETPKDRRDFLLKVLGMVR